MNQRECRPTYILLLGFAPLLVATGTAGFLLPTTGAMSTAPAYNIFHIAFGLLGLSLLIRRNDTVIQAFVIGFGAIDLYQAAASNAELWPQQYFLWTPTDDVAHIAVGFLLIIAGVYDIVRFNHAKSARS